MQWSTCRFLSCSFQLSTIPLCFTIICITNGALQSPANEEIDSNSQQHHIATAPSASQTEHKQFGEQSEADAVAGRVLAIWYWNSISFKHLFWLTASIKFYMEPNLEPPPFHPNHLPPEPCRCYLSLSFKLWLLRSMGNASFNNLVFVHFATFPK